MTLEETIAILHGWIGRELEVAIRTDDGMVVAYMAGELALGSDLSARVGVGGRSITRASRARAAA